MVLLSGMIGGFAFGVMEYADAIDLFGLKRVLVSGTSLVSQEEVIALAEVEPGTSLFAIPLDSVQKRVGANPFIKVAAASRQFPRTLCIQVHERTPLAYLNAGKLYSIDSTGYIMPMPAAGPQLGIPILSGLTKMEELQVNGPAEHDQVLQMVNILTDIRRTYPGLYPQISELVHTERDNYVLFTTEGATRIMLGSQQFTRKIHLLEAFWATVGTGRSWGDYEYIDLRFQKQVIVREQT